MRTFTGIGLTRVTVAAPSRRIDVALPDQVAVIELLPNLLDHAGEGLADDGEKHGGWSLRRADGVTVDSARSLGAQGVRDGEVLHLVPARTEWPELDYDDIVEAIAGGARRSGRLWAGPATRTSALAVTALILVLGLVAIAASDPFWLAGLVAMVTALVLVVTGTVLSRAGGDALAGAALAGFGLPYAFAGGFLVLGGDTALLDLGAPHLLAGSTALMIFAALGFVGVVGSPRLFVTALVVGFFGVIAGLLGLTSLAPGGVAAIVVSVLMASLATFPLLAIRIGRLPIPVLPQTPADMVKDTPLPERRSVYAAVVRSDELLTGMLTGGALVAAGCMAALITDRTSSSVVLAVVVAVALLLRARLFPAVRQRVPLLVAGLAGAAGLGVIGTLALDPELRLVSLAVVLVVAGLVAVSGLLYSRKPPSPQLGRLADVFDIVAVLAVVPIACSVVGLYGFARGLAG